MPHHKTADDITELYWGLHLTPILLNQTLWGLVEMKSTFFPRPKFEFKWCWTFSHKMFWWYRGLHGTQHNPVRCDSLKCSRVYYRVKLYIVLMWNWCKIMKENVKSPLSNQVSSQADRENLTVDTPLWRFDCVTTQPYLFSIIITFCRVHYCCRCQN